MAEPTVEPAGPGEWSPEVAPLLALGSDGSWDTEWPDYPARFGLRDEHVPELIRMATWDPGAELSDEAFEASTEVWAPVHAWRALGQLGADEAAEPLAELLWQAGNHDVIREEVPRALGMIGAEAVAELTELLEDSDADDWVRAAAADGLATVAELHPDARDEAVAPIVLRLGEFLENSPALNARLIGELLNLRLAAAAPLMEQAFAADAVDVSVCGDWEDVQIELGLLEGRITPRPDYQRDLRARLGMGVQTDEPGSSDRGATRKHQRSARKRKLEKASRKRNRKKR
jgi:hypothetical protein